MFTITNKLRALVAIGAVGAVLGSAGVASALPVSHAGTATTTAALTATTTAIPEAIDPNKVDSKGDVELNVCVDWAKEYNGELENVRMYAQMGENPDVVASAINDAAATYTKFADNCVVTD